LIVISLKASHYGGPQVEGSGRVGERNAELLALASEQLARRGIGARAFYNVFL